jgi:hypothetical protein
LASGTLIWLSALCFEPLRRLGLVDDREDFDPLFFDVIEHSHLSGAEPELRLVEAPETLDPTLAQLLGLESEVALNDVLDLPSYMRSKGP